MVWYLYLSETPLSFPGTGFLLYLSGRRKGRIYALVFFLWISIRICQRDHERTGDRRIADLSLHERSVSGKRKLFLLGGDGGFAADHDAEGDAFQFLLVSHGLSASGEKRIDR